MDVHAIQNVLSAYIVIVVHCHCNRRGSVFFIAPEFFEKMTELHVVNCRFVYFSLKLVALLFVHAILVRHVR